MNANLFSSKGSLVMRRVSPGQLEMVSEGTVLSVPDQIGGGGDSGVYTSEYISRLCSHVQHTLIVGFPTLD